MSTSKDYFVINQATRVGSQQIRISGDLILKGNSKEFYSVDITEGRAPDTNRLPQTITWVLPSRSSELYDNIKNLPFFLGMLALGFYSASRVSEVFRSSLLSVPHGLYQAAYSTGLRPVKIYRYIVAPYAFRLSIPPLTTEFLTCFKNSALTMTIGVMEITGTTAYIESFTWRGLEATTSASLSYLTITLGIILFMSIVERNMSIKGMIRQER